MFKNIKKYLIIGILVLLPMSVKAISGDYSLSCGSNSLKVGTSTKCYVSGHFTEPILGAEIVVGSSSNISITNVALGGMGKIAGDLQPNSDIILNGNVGANTTVTFLSFDAKLNSESSNSYVSVSKFSVSDANYEDSARGAKSFKISKIEEAPKTDTTPTNNNTNNNTNNKSNTTNNKTETKTTTVDNKKNNDSKKTEDKNKEEDKKKKEEDEKKKKEEEAKKKEEENNLTVATSSEATKTVGENKLEDTKTTIKSPKNEKDNSLLLVTIVVCILFIVIVSFVAYRKVKEKKII